MELDLNALLNAPELHRLELAEKQKEINALKDQLKQARALPTARDALISIWDNYINNYLTVDTFAEHNRLDHDQAERFLFIAKLIATTPERED